MEASAPPSDQPAPQYADYWRYYQEVNPNANVGPMPEEYVPPNLRRGPGIYYHPTPGLDNLNPVDCSETRPDSTNLPEDFAGNDILSPLLYFRLFLTDEILELLATNTNEYAEHLNAYTGPDNNNPTPTGSQRVWTPTCAEEVKIWIGINLYMGFLGEQDVRGCWDTYIGTPEISEHMSLQRFQQIRRYFHIYGPSPFDHMNPNDTPAEIRPPWFFKFEPVCQILRPLFRQYLKPGTFCAIDECIAQFTGRTKHKTHIERKPTPDGYKIIALAFTGYIWDFLWWSGDSADKTSLNAPGPSLYNDLWEHQYGFKSRSQQAVLSLCMSLPYFDSTFAVFMDNYYTSVKLFAFMRVMFGVGAVGTIRTGEQKNTDFPRQITKLKDGKLASQAEWTYLVTGEDGRRHVNPEPRPQLTALEKRQQEWGWMEMEVTRSGVYCLGWNDNKFVLLMSTIHSPPRSINDYIVRKRKRRPNPRPAVKEIFGEYSARLLPIPKVIDDYNNYMNGVDRADQARQYITTHKKGWRNWLPIFWWILDTMGTNAYYLYCLHACEVNATSEFVVGNNGEDMTEEKWAYGQKAWLQHVAMGLMQDGSRKMKGHVRSTEILKDATVFIHRTELQPRTMQRMKLSERIHSKVKLNTRRFNRPQAQHQPVKIENGRPFCRWCQFLNSGTRRPSRRHPLQPGDTNWDNIEPRYKIVTERTSQTRFKCGHCETPLCVKRTDGRDCWAAFHDYWRDGETD